MTTPDDEDQAAERSLGPAYLPGEVVDIGIQQARVVVSSDPDAGVELVTVEFRNGTRVTVDTRADWIHVQRQVPADGMPKPGEIWEDRFGGQYFVKATASTSSDPAYQVVFVGPDKTGSSESFYELQKIGPLRRIWSPPGGGAR